MHSGKLVVHENDAQRVPDSEKGFSTPTVPYRESPMQSQEGALQSTQPPLAQSRQTNPY